MTPDVVLFAAEALLLAFGIGATVWFFFVQTPALLMGLGMERFLPLQMRLVGVHAKALAATSLLVLLAAGLRGGPGPGMIPAAVAALAAVANAWFVVPRALRSGGQALRAVRQGERPEANLASFASTGGGKPTKLWHRMVVVAVLVMTGGFLMDGVDLLGPPRTEAHAAHAKLDVMGRADPVTAMNVRHLHGMVRAHQARPIDTPVTNADVEALNEAFVAIFRDCTMEGPDHDALHELLIPVGDALDRASNPAEAREALAFMDTQLAGFDRSFQVGE